MRKIVSFVLRYGLYKTEEYSGSSMLCTHTRKVCICALPHTHTHTTGLILSNNNVLNCNDALIFMYIKYLFNSSIRPLIHTKEFSESHISVHCSKVVKLFNVHLKKILLGENSLDLDERETSITYCTVILIHKCIYA